MEEQRIPETRLTPRAAVGLVEDLALHGSFSVSEADQADERDALRWILEDRQRWINAAARIGHVEARVFATEGWATP